VRVTAQLVQVSDGYHLWSETYDGDLGDIFAVQDDIARQILAALKERLAIEPTAEPAPAMRTDVTAYSLFLEARDLILTRDAQGLRRAIDLLDRAIAIDAAYAPAYAARGKAYLLSSDLPSMYGDIPAKKALQLAESNADRALELNPNLLDARNWLALALKNVGRIREALDFRGSIAWMAGRPADALRRSAGARPWIACAQAARTRG